MKKILAFFKRLFGFGKSKDTRGSILRDDKYALVIGVEKSAKFGSCPGARNDSNRVRNLLNQRVGHLEFLQDNSATKANILAKMRSLIQQVPAGGIFIMTYSGHGGSQAFPDTHDEADGNDEYLCCYDTYLKDDLIWSEITRCRGKVFLFFDCCHSETMFRAPLIPPQDLTKDDDIVGVSSRDSKIPNSPVDMLVWSGCPDNTYSYGDSNGGLLTNAMLSAINAGKTTYNEIWSRIKSDRTLSRYSQIPQQTVLGKFDIASRFCE